MFSSAPLHLVEAPETTPHTRSRRVVLWLIIVCGFLRLIAYGKELPCSEQRSMASNLLVHGRLSSADILSTVNSTGTRMPGQRYGNPKPL